nr:hypothetical protein [Candidatus Paceibacterota bacterium]
FFVHMGFKETKKFQLETIDLIDQMSNHTVTSIENLTVILGEAIKTQGRIIDQLTFLYKVVFFILTLLLLAWVVLLQKPFKESVNIYLIWWSNLSEGWKILIVSLPAMVIAQIIGNLIYKKITKK